MIVKPFKTPPFDEVAIEATHYDCHLSFRGRRFHKVRWTVGRKEAKRRIDKARCFCSNLDSGVGEAIRIVANPSSCPAFKRLLKEAGICLNEVAPNKPSVLIDHLVGHEGQLD